MRALRLLAVALGCSAIALLHPHETAPEQQPERAPVALATLGDLRPGDVVFVRVPDAFWAQLASQWSSPAFRHGHVGMAAEIDGRLLIVHAAGNPQKDKALIAAEELAAFAEGADRVDVFRPSDQAAADRAAKAAASFFARKLMFDADFSLASASRLYCTELIWRALSQGFGRDILPRKSAVAGRQVVLLSDLERSEELEFALSAH